MLENATRIDNPQDFALSADVQFRYLTRIIGLAFACSLHTTSHTPRTRCRQLFKLYLMELERSRRLDLDLFIT